MRITLRLIPLLLGIFCFIPLPPSSSLPSNSNFFLGIPPQDEDYFKGEVIKCKNGSKRFTKAQLNDDFCDCPDGTDEPGTSACPQGKFYCRNAGHVPTLLFSSRVNDGICDCCDGSDEYDGKVKCPNTCWEAGKVARDKLRKKIEIYREGVAIRKQDIEKAKQTIAGEKAELPRLKNEEKSLKKLVKQLKEQIQKLEEKANQPKEEEMKEAAMEKFDMQKRDAKEDFVDQKEALLRKSNNEKAGLPEESPSGQHEKDGSESTEGLSKEELGRLVASRWTGKRSGHETDKTVTAQSSLVGALSQDSSAPSKPGLEDQENLSDIKTLSSQSWLDKIQATARNLFQSVNLFSTSIDNFDVDNIREKYEDSTRRLSDVQSRISSLTEKLQHDFGIEKEFYFFYDRCFEIKQDKYVYKACPFKHAIQEEGHSETRLGSWEKFENSYRIMLFSNGESCWNGPDRSLKVKMRCGLKTELTNMDEPSRCEYAGLMLTPAVCLEGKLEELEQKLESMNREQPESHDEL